MQELDQDWQTILLSLTANKVQFVLIDGLAMSAQGCSHVTSKIKISYSTELANLPRVVDALTLFKPRLRGVEKDLPFIFDVRTLRNVSNLTLVTEFGDLDILGNPAGIDSFEGLFERSTVMEIYGVEVQVASIDDLIAMKRAANRPKDHNHILELLRLKALRIE